MAEYEFAQEESSGYFLDGYLQIETVQMALSLSGVDPRTKDFLLHILQEFDAQNENNPSAPFDIVVSSDEPDCRDMVLNSLEQLSEVAGVPEEVRWAAVQMLELLKVQEEY